MTKWRSIPGYEGIYEVSSFGDVKTLRLNRLCRPTKTRYGYLVVGLFKDRICRARLVHTLVALAFLGPKPFKHDVCHWNGIKTDNRLVNLRYATRKENEADKLRHGGKRLFRDDNPTATAKAARERIADLRRMGICLSNACAWVGVSRRAALKYPECRIGYQKRRSPIKTSGVFA